MDISAGLIAKAVGGTAAVAAASGASYVYRDEIGSLFSDSGAGVVDNDHQEETESNGINSLGLPDGCKLESATYPVECTLNANALKGINFSEKGSETITLNEDSISVKLKVEKTTGDNTFPENLKFTFFPPKNIDIKKGDKAFVTLKKDTDPEFKIKKDSSDKWSLEKAWNVTELGKKVSLTCSSDSKECFFDGTTATNLLFWNGNEATKTMSKDNTKKFKYEEDHGKFNQGFKFTVKDSEIDFEGDKKLPENSTYEIIEKGGKWYLKRVWSIEKLAKEVGFKSCSEENSEKVCEFKKSNGEINVMESSNKVTGLKIAADGGKAKFEKGKSGYEGGFKITIQNNDVDLTGGDPSSPGIQKLFKDPASYEIKFEDGKWYLSKKSDN